MLDDVANGENFSNGCTDLLPVYHHLDHPHLVIGGISNFQPEGLKIYLQSNGLVPIIYRGHEFPKLRGFSGSARP